MSSAKQEAMDFLYRHSFLTRSASQEVINKLTDNGFIISAEWNLSEAEEAAEQQGYANAMEAERKLHESNIESLKEERDKTYQALLKVTKIHDEVEAKLSESEALLAKAVEALGTALDEMVDYADTHPAWAEIWQAREAARTYLAELKGEK